MEGNIWWQKIRHVYNKRGLLIHSRLCDKFVSWWCHGRCHRMAKGWAVWTLVIPGRASTLESVHGIHAQHTLAHPIYPGLGPSCGGNTPTPACLSLYLRYMRLQCCSLSCMSSQSLYPEEEDVLRGVSRVLSGGKWEAIPHAGGGEGLYIASHHTDVLLDIVHYTQYTVPVH